MANTLGYFCGGLGMVSAFGDPQSAHGGIYPAVFTPPEADAPPVVDAFVPAPGEIVRTQPLRFDVRDNKGLAAVTVLVRFEAVPPSTQRPYEVIYDSEGFSDAYAARSSVEHLTDTHWRFSVLRAGGWPSAPRLKVIAADGLVAE